MGRKRFISSDISTDKKIAVLAEENPTAALMWPWFTTALDDWGRMAADPLEVKLTLFPAFSYTSKEIAEAIRLFAATGLAHYYTVDGKPYLAVNPNTWFKYQTYIDSKRKTKDGSKLPAPDNAHWINGNEQQETANVANNVQNTAINLSDEQQTASSDENIADDLQEATKIVPSLSLSLSPSKEKAVKQEDENQKTAADSFNSILKTFYELTGKSTITPNTKEIDAIRRFTDETCKGIPPDFILESMREVAATTDVTSIKYFAKAVPDRWAQTQKERNKPYDFSRTEAAFSEHMMNGGDPDDFNWSKEH